MPFGDSARSLTTSSASASSLRTALERCQQLLPRFRQPQPARVALDQPDRKALLQRAQMAARGRVRHAQALRRPWTGCRARPSWRTPPIAAGGPFLHYRKRDFEYLTFISAFRKSKYAPQHKQDSRRGNREMSGPIRHIVMWRLRGETPAERSAARVKVKTLFEGLRGRIDGLTHIEVGARRQRCRLRLRRRPGLRIHRQRRARKPMPPIQNICACGRSWATCGSGASRSIIPSKRPAHDRFVHL